MNEPVSCGIDIEEINRFKKFVTFPNTIEPFITSVFTAEEIKHSLSFGNLLPFAAGFSFKESVFKAFGVSWTNSMIKWQEVELLFPETNNIDNFELKLSGYAQKLYNDKGFNKFDTSLDFTEEYVVTSIVFVNDQH
jgi:phosphopantetheine--protein transferase-like protein